MRQGLLQNSAFAEMINEMAVPCIAHMGSTRGPEHSPETVTDPRTGQQVTRCPLYPTTTCDIHHAMYREAPMASQVRGTPSTFIVGPDGTVIFGADELRQSSTQFFRTKFEEAQRRLGPGVPGSVYDRVMSDLARVDDLMEQGDVRSAIRLCEVWSEEDRIPQGIRDLATTRLGTIRDEGMHRVEEARTARDVRTLRNIRRDFRGIDEVTDAAAAAIEELGG